MPVKPTFPGVYVQEIPSGVRTITGVSTSIAAFFGTAPIGPVNEAITITSYADYERKYGGISSDSEMSYNVKQFFMNGGSQAVIVRLAPEVASPAAIAASADATAAAAAAAPGDPDLDAAAEKAADAARDRDSAKIILADGTNDIIELESLEIGSYGNNIEIRVDHPASNPTDFNLTAIYTSPLNANQKITEVFQNLSMDATHSRYFVKIIGQGSTLIKATRLAAASTDRPVQVPSRAELVSAKIDNLAAINSAIQNGKNKVLLSLDQAVPVQVSIPSTVANLIELVDNIQTAVRALRPGSLPFDDFTCIAIPIGTEEKLVLSSGSRGSNSSVEITKFEDHDLADLLKLTINSTANDATFTPAEDVKLLGGHVPAIDDTNRYATFVGNQAARTGIYALEEVDLFNIMCLPGVVDSGILMEAEAYCRTRRAFLIVDSDPNAGDTAEMISSMSGLPVSDSAAVYFPWFQIADPLNGGQLRETAPCGTIAGLYARTDTNRGVWKAPAGTSANLNGVLGLEYVLTDRENGLLNPLGINCLRRFPSSGLVSWGARTLQGNDDLASEYKYIPIRRTAYFIEESLYRGTQWVVFEPNDEKLWSQIRLNVGAFMHNLYTKGAFQGKKKDAYFVKCDSETTTQTDINMGVVNIVVGFAPLKPAEFVIISFQQIAGNIEV